MSLEFLTNLIFILNLLKTLFSHFPDGWWL